MISFCTHSSRAMGIEAADVLPYRSTFLNTRSAGNFKRCPTASMIRSLAWCGMKTLISSLAKPCSFKSSAVTSAMALTATLKVSLPFIRIYGSLCSMDFGSLGGWFEPPPGMQMKSAYSPLDFIRLPRIPWSPFVAWSTTAPAPSPNRTQVERSLQSTYRVRISPPMTRTFSALLDWMSPSARWRP